MPELIEVAQYAASARLVIGRQITSVEAPDTWYLKAGLTAALAADVLLGQTVVGVRRHGKLLLLDFEAGPVLGLRFGMTGRLLVDGQSAIERLEYGSSRQEPAWNRFTLIFTDGGDLVMQDPRRLGGVTLDPDEAALGTDVATATLAGLAEVLARSSAPLKARLMDQAKLAGLGNLLTDEVLWRACLDPARMAGSLAVVEVAALHHHLAITLAVLAQRGGSHLGDLQVARRLGGLCPRCGAALARRAVGGRRTYSCPLEQR